MRTEGVMFALRRKGTVIAEGLKIVGTVTAEGLVEVHGNVDGDLLCTSLVVSQKACIQGGIQANRVVVNGNVKGPIKGGEVILRSCAVVVGDIETESLAIERGAFFEGRSMHANGTSAQTVIGTKSPTEILRTREAVRVAGKREIVSRPGAVAEVPEDRVGPVLLGSQEDAKKASQAS
jgi:cytoskeletal protein CcmA (bactofilin family)